MSKNRLEAFSDGVIAILITIMMLDLKVPSGGSLADLKGLWPTFSCYLLSFVFLGIYWNNHHHLLQAAERIHGVVLWANLHLLFWLSIIPFGTYWMGRNHFSTIPVAVYGINLFMSGFSYYLLTRSLLKHHHHESPLARAIGKDSKGMISLGLYLIAIPLAFLSTVAALTIFVAVAVLWLYPDSRIEKVIDKEK